MKNTSYRKLINDEDRKWVKNLIKKYWGSEKVVVHGAIYYPSELEGFIAENKSEKQGLITYNIENGSCEIITLNTIVENTGIGTNLVKLVIDEARLRECDKVWLITTNDNLRAIDFYRKLGFILSRVYPDAVANSRKIKPEIPLIGENGVPIRDELEFVLNLTQ
jgi:RimJ/RimL family protein N-acetyltransferase